jgi:REP element-mobilizing transposase RayT
MHGTIAHHLVISAYGFWLPNDPRGSWSQYVGSPDLFQFGPATKTVERRSKAHEEHDSAARQEAKTALKYPSVRFTQAQVRVVAAGFEQYVRKSGLVVRACSVMPDHAHFVLDPFRVSVEQVSNLLKGASTAALTRAGAHPFESHRSRGKVPKCWAEGQWDRWITDGDDLRRCIKYVEQNPEKAGLPVQQWSFVTPFPA